MSVLKKTDGRRRVSFMRWLDSRLANGVGVQTESLVDGSPESRLESEVKIPPFGESRTGRIQA